MSNETTAAVERAQQQINAMLGDNEPKFVPSHARSVLNAALSVEEIARALGEHRIECTGLEGVTCRGCRELGWMSRLAFEQHQATALRTALLGGAS